MFFQTLPSLLPPPPPHHPHPRLVLLLHAVVVLLALTTLLPPRVTANGHSLGTECPENGAFSCHGSDSTSFTRCIDDQLYLFHCPSGLHFSMVSQTCDWPEHADCSSSSSSGGGGDGGGGGGHHDQEEEKNGGGESSSSSSSSGSREDEGDYDYDYEGEDASASHDSVWGGGERNEEEEQQQQQQQQQSSEDWKEDYDDWEDSNNNNKVASGTSGVSKSASRDSPSHSASSASASDSTANRVSSGSGENPWWRPAHVDPKAWEDVSNLVEVPFDGSVSVSASAAKNGEAAGGEQKKSGSKTGTEGGRKNGESGSHGHSHQPIISSDTAESRARLENVQWHEGPCRSSECRPPHCRCPGTDIPGGLSPRSTPQMVMLTFDDEVSAAYYGYFQRLFRPGRYNPNGCPVRGCLFVSGSGTNYDLVYPLYAMGVEIASHTLSHKFPHTWWSTASYREYVDEVEGMRRSLASKAGVPHEAVKGFRVPFLQLGSDNMYKALYDNKFLYDTSMFTGSVWEGSDPVWPFTLDYTIPEVYCQHGPCPKKQYPGLWEIPVQRWYGVDGHSCAMPDGCTASADMDEDLEFFRSNFKRYYESNRAPFGIFVHARWFHTEHHLDALDRFIDELMQLDDVYIVTPSQVIEWMKSPTPLNQLQSFRPWNCEGSLEVGSLWNR